MPTVDIPMDHFNVDAYGTKRFVERFQAREIKLHGADDDAPSLVDEHLKEPSQPPYAQDLSPTIPSP